MTTIPTSGLDVDALRSAYATRDTAGLLALYADDAAVEIVDAVHLVDAVHPPSNPRRLAGCEALRAHFDDVFARDMTHELDRVLAGIRGRDAISPAYQARQSRHDQHLPAGHRHRGGHRHRPRPARR